MFGKPHPALEGFKEPNRAFGWLVETFFRLHRRRAHSESGFQALGFQEMRDFAEHVLRLSEDLRPLYYRAMEETDNAVLYDHYTKVREDAEKAKSEAAKASRKPSKRRPK